MYRYRCFRNYISNYASALAHFVVSDYCCVYWKRNATAVLLHKDQEIQTSNFLITTYCLLCKDAANCIPYLIAERYGMHQTSTGLYLMLISCVVKEAECHTVYWKLLYSHPTEKYRPLTTQHFSVCFCVCVCARTSVYHSATGALVSWHFLISLAELISCEQ